MLLLLWSLLLKLAELGICSIRLDMMMMMMMMHLDDYFSSAVAVAVAAVAVVSTITDPTIVKCPPMFHRRRII